MRLGSEAYFSARLSSHGEAEQGRLFGVALHLELCKSSSVSFNGLRHLPVHRVQLHRANHAVLLRKKSTNTEQGRDGTDPKSRGGGGGGAGGVCLPAQKCR